MRYSFIKANVITGERHSQPAPSLDAAVEMATSSPEYDTFGWVLTVVDTEQCVVAYQRSRNFNTRSDQDQLKKLIHTSVDRIARKEHLIDTSALIQEVAKLRNKADGHDYVTLDRAVSVISIAKSAGLQVMEPKNVEDSINREEEYLKNGGISWTE